VTLPDPPAAPPASASGWLDWAGVGLVALSAALAALLEALLVPYYVGSVVVPIAVVLAVVSNVWLPRLARQLVPTTLAMATPFLTWLIVMVGFGVLARPEGDVILPGGSGAVHWVTYGVLLGGALVGTVNLVVLSTPAPPRAGPTGRPAPRKGSALSR
jgi:hypothetical protein